jgi:hypothetical protein
MTNVDIRVLEGDVSTAPANPAPGSPLPPAK